MPGMLRNALLGDLLCTHHSSLHPEAVCAADNRPVWRVTALSAAGNCNIMQVFVCRNMEKVQCIHSVKDANGPAL